MTDQTTTPDLDELWRFVDWLIDERVAEHAATLPDADRLGLGLTTPDGKRTLHVSLRGDLEDVRDDVVRELATGRYAYINTFVTRVTPGVTKRGTNAEVAFRLAHCIDLDVRPEDDRVNIHAKGALLPTRDQAEAYVAHLRADYGIHPAILHTGGGFHLWIRPMEGVVLSDDPDRFQVDADLMLAADLARYGIDHGWQADTSPTRSATLMLRPAGCIRAKADGVHVVRMQRAGHPWYETSDRERGTGLFDPANGLTDLDVARAHVARMSRWTADARKVADAGGDVATTPVPDFQAPRPRARFDATARDLVKQAHRAPADGDGYTLTRGQRRALLLDPADVLEALGWTVSGSNAARPGSRSGRSAAIYDDALTGYPLVILFSDGALGEFDGQHVQDAASLLRHACGGSHRHAEALYRLLRLDGDEVTNAVEVLDLVTECGSPEALCAYLEARGLVRLGVAA